MSEPITLAVPHGKFHSPCEVQRHLIDGGIPARVWDSSSWNIRVTSGTLDRYYDLGTDSVMFRWTPAKETTIETA